jgi:gamma-glutamyltranspeptidase/glutathione hydrolase
MGGDTQPQYVLQMLAASLRHGRDAGRVLGQARWKIAADDDGGGFDTWRPGHGREVRVEEHMHAEIVDGLAARGHQVRVAHSSDFGHAHLIEVTEHGSLAGAADPRALTGAAGGY